MAGPGRPGPGKASPGRPGLARAGHFFARVTERALEQLIPIIGHQMKFLKALERLREEGGSDASKVVSALKENYF